MQRTRSRWFGDVKKIEVDRHSRIMEELATGGKTEEKDHGVYGCTVTWKRGGME